MKRLRQLINYSVWGILAILVIGIVAIHTPIVQHYLGGKVASAVGEKLGTQVSVGRIDIGMMNRLIVDDFLILDHNNEEMLKAGRLSVKIDLLSLLKGRLSISSVQLFGAHAHLYKDSLQATPNYQFVLDSLASTDSVSNNALDLRINSLIIRHSGIRYDRNDVFQTPGKLNPSHLDIDDISAHIIIKELRQDSLNVNVKRLAFTEQSGLIMERLSLKFTANKNKMRLESLNIKLPYSELGIDSLVASYNVDNINESLLFEGRLSESLLRPADFVFLAKELHPFNQTLTINGSFIGTANSIDLQRLSISSDNGYFNLQGSGSIITKDKIPSWQAQVNQLSVSQHLLEQLQQGFEGIPKEITRIGHLNLTGKAYGKSLEQLEAVSDIRTSIGSVSAVLTLTDSTNFAGQLSTDSLHLGQLLDNKQLGKIATNISFVGNSHQLESKGAIDLLEYKSYAYQNITIDGTYKQGDIMGKLQINDPNIQTELEGELSQQGRRSSVRLTGFVKNLKPSALHITDKWGNNAFSAIIDVDFTASNINDAEGTFDIDDFTMTSGTPEAASYSLDNLHIKSGYDDDIHFLHINGDMGEIDLNGVFDWATLPQSFVNYIAAKLPTLPGLPSQSKITSNDFEATLRLVKSDWLQQLLGIDLTLHSPVHLSATVNDNTHTIEVRGNAPAFTYNGGNFQGSQLRLTTEGDTTRCLLQLTKLSEESTKLSLTLQALAADNNLTTSLLWDNGLDTHSVRGVAHAVTQFYTNEQNKPEAHIRVLPSEIMVWGKPWILEPCDILYSDKHLLVDHFSLAHHDQYVIIDGLATASPNDTLTVDLNNIDTEYVLNLVDFHSVSFAGLASGRAYATGLFDVFQAKANVTVEDFIFQDGRMGTLKAAAEWNNAEGQIDIAAKAIEDAHAQTIINGFVSPVRSDIDLKIQAQGSNIEFCNSFTDSFLNQVEGTAYGNLRISGPLGGMNLTGEVVANGQANVTVLNTSYQMRNDTIRFIPNEILFTNAPIYDRDGHTAYLTGAVHHDELSDFTFDFDIEAQELLAYDFPDFGDDIICGTVYATGTADLHGRPDEVVINVNVTPAHQSVFAYNAAKTDAISKQEFISWGTKNSSHPASGTQHSESVNQHPTPNHGTDIYINFLVNATPESTLRILMDAKTDDYITLNGNGGIRASYHNKGPFQMFGTYNIEHGTYGITIQQIIKKNFTFQNGGTIVFGGDPFNANLNMQALYTVNGVSLSDLNLGSSFTNNTVRVNCLMNIQGTPAQPRVEFDLELPTVNSEENQMIRSVIASEQEMNQQVLYLLGIGRFYTQGANNASVQQYDQTTLAMQSFLSGTVSTQINEVLAQIIKSNDWNFGANISTGNEGWHNAEYEGLVSGRMLNNRLLINGQFGYRDNATQATPSFIGDFDIRYLLTANGNLAVKVYNQTNDRYFTRSSLNTQGVGLIMKKDFNGLADLFHSRRRKSEAPK